MAKPLSVTAGHSSPGQIEGGVLLQRRLIGWALALTVGISVAAAVVGARALGLDVDH